MPQVTLHAPDITCDHCIATIRRTVEQTGGARFLAGDSETQSFVVELDSGAVLDRLGAALAEEGYPLGEPGAAAGEAAHDGQESPTDHPVVPKQGWTPEYRVTRTEAGADVNYACYCGCEAGFALDRSQGAQDPEGCCCGNRILAGRDAAGRLRAALDDPAAYDLDVRQVTLPWGQPVDVALAVPRD